MPRVESHKQGKPSWIDLSTTDQDAAKEFYSKLFGWTYQDNPMGPGMVYSMALVNGMSAGAIYQQQQGEADLGFPPHWNVYFTVNEVDATVAKAKEHGCTVFAEPMDVFEAGRMAVVQDPTGAQFQLWTPITHIGTEVAFEHGALAWAELLTTDQERAGEFYTDLLGVDLDTGAMPMPDGSQYHMTMIEDMPASGIMAMPSELSEQGIPPHWEMYIQVDDANATVEIAKENGGQVLFGPVQIPMAGNVATLMDPQGAVFGIQQPEG